MDSHACMWLAEAQGGLLGVWEHAWCVTGVNVLADSCPCTHVLLAPTSQCVPTSCMAQHYINGTSADLEALHKLHAL